MLLENENKDIGSFLDSVICQFSKMKVNYEYLCIKTISCTD